MKKSINKGFMLAETLVVTTFVVGVLIFLFIQFTNLTKNYNDHYKYNTVEGLYSLKTIRNYIINDTSAYTAIKEKIDTDEYVEITDCTLFTDIEYCSKLLELQNINKIYISYNDFNKNLFINFDDGFKKFVDKINSEGDEEYRILVHFNDSTYATIRIGE